MLTETQTLITSQIQKIFSIIEKNSDNSEICKIAIETLSNKCLESPIFIFSILSNFLDYTYKGNLKLVEDSSLLLESFFEDFSYRDLQKILSNEIFKSQISKIASQEHYQTNETIAYIINNKNFNLENVTSMDFISFNILNNFNIEKFECLYSKDKDLSLEKQGGEMFSKMEMKLLFPDEGMRKDLEMDLSVEQCNEEKIQTEQLIHISNYYKTKSEKFKFENVDVFNNNNNSNSNGNSNSNQGVKVRKINSKIGKQKKMEIKLNPFIFFIQELVKFNCLSYSQRLCSTTILRILQKYFNKIFYPFYSVSVLYSDDETIDEISVDKTLIYCKELIEKEQIDMITKLVINSILDKVVDYNNQDFICISKEMNLKLTSLIIQEAHNEKMSQLLTKNMLILLKQFFNVKNDWQPLFAVLTFFKYLFISSYYVSDKTQLFELLRSLMTTKYEDILNLLIQILDKILDSNSVNTFLQNEQITKMFFSFINLIYRYDDIESGVKYYFNCLFNFIKYFLDNNNNIQMIFDQLKILMNNDFILHSLNKIICVRVKYFEVMTNLISGKFPFEYDFIIKSALIAYQGLCIEEDKTLLKIQQLFLLNMLNSNNAYVRIFYDNQDNIFNLLLEIHISSLNSFYVPKNSKIDSTEIEDLYKSFFVNQIQIEKINQAYERKLLYIIPIISMLLKVDIEFTKVVCSKLDLSCIYANDPNNNQPFVLRRKLLILLKIYVYYLEFIESNENKMLIINDEILKYLSENITLNEMPIRINRMNIENSIGLAMHYFYNEAKGSLGVDNKDVMFLGNLLAYLNSERNLNIKELNDCMKNIYDAVKAKNNTESLKVICKDIKCIKDSLTMIEKNQYIHSLRTKVRGYASVSLFIHSIYTNVKSAKISSITNSFLNCLKLNIKEGKIFVKYLLKLILTLENKETVTKIIFTFIENSLKIYNEVTQDETKSNSEICIFKPIKYFFAEFANYEKYSDIQKILNDYQNSLIKDKESERKKITLLYLLCPIKKQLKCFSFDKFKEIIKEYNKYSQTKNILHMVSIILINSEKIFENCNIKNILAFLFESIDLKSDKFDYSIFIFKVIESILQDNKISTSSIDFIFTVLNYINYKNPQIRQLATSIFSKQMKIISMLKFDTNYDEIVKNSNVTSLDFITKIFTQNIYDIKELKIPIKEKLRTYQLIGINWLLFLGNYSLGLALCDDMGLGKTIQTLVTIAHTSIEYLDKNGKMPVSLIICPTTLILNWILESTKFFNSEDLIIKQLENTNSSSSYEGQSVKFQSRKALAPRDNKTVTIYITSYEKVRENNNDIFTVTEFFYLVLDEAHIIKNPKTKMYQSIRKITSERRLILTGTPIQNNVMELWSLFDFLMPGFLGNENDFEIKYHKKMHSNIKKLNLEEKLQENIFQASLTEIRKRIKPFILRRLKSDVLQELPEKIILDYNCEMTPSQKEIYNKWTKIYEEPNNKDSSLSLIDKLRKICNHPNLLLDEQHKKDTKDANALINNSGKLKSLEELLISLGFDSGTTEKSSNFSYENKVLIFTQYKQMCNILKFFLDEKFPSLTVLTLTSDTKPKERSGIIIKYNSDPSVNIMILTTSIGGLGISLTSANIVIMYDHNWNPTKDMQAIDRAHRLGQKKTVQVFRMITVGSIEEQLISLQTFKRYIANNVVDPNKIHETKINANSMMESFEEFSNSKIENEEQERKKNQNGAKKKINKIEELTRENEENALKEELEIEYLKKLINKD